jgi:hypothetical protein
MTKLGKQPSVPNINGTAYKFKPTRHARLKVLLLMLQEPFLLWGP